MESKRQMLNRIMDYLRADMALIREDREKAKTLEDKSYLMAYDNGVYKAFNRLQDEINRLDAR